MQFISEAAVWITSHICHFQEAHPAAFPLFINSQQFLLLLDASLPGQTFFEYQEDGSLARHVEGWADDDGPLSFLPDLDDEVEEDEEDEAEQAEEDVADLEHEHGGVREKRRVDPRRYITYEVDLFNILAVLRNYPECDCCKIGC